MRHTISLLVENKFGVLSRIASLFSGRGYNIESLSVGETIDPQISIMTIVTSGDDQIIDQVVKQLNRLVDTIKVVDLTGKERTERELAMISVSYQKGSLEELKNINDIFRGKVVDINNKSITLEITGPPAKVNAAVNVLMPYGIIEMARSGTVALRRGEQLRQPNYL